MVQRVSAEGECRGRYWGFKRKNSKYKKSEPATADEFFKGVDFIVGSQVPEL